MNIIYAILDILRNALVWSLGLVLDREPQTGEALRLYLLLVATGFATWLAFYWRDFALRSRVLRRRLEPHERYAGPYLQAIQRGDEIRYAIVRIGYNHKKKRFDAFGRIYSPAGNELSAFQSRHVFFPAEDDDGLEFIWDGRRAASGYTSMKIEDRDGDYIEGSGYVIAFGLKPKTYPMLFKRLFGADVREVLDVDTPSHPGEEASFIRSFHERLGEKVRQSFEGAAEELP
jgi:hypothetical protein